MKHIHLVHRHSELLGQFVRYALTGGLASLVNIGVYWVLAARGMDPNVAWTLGYVAAVAVGYVVHSRWSFAAERSGGEGRMIARFLAVAAFALALNSLWVWVLTGLLHLHPLAPVPAMLFVTPLLSFLLNRYWVFEAA